MLSRRLDDLLTLTKPDSIPVLNSVDALLFSHDVDRTETLGGRAWGRVPDSIGGICEELGLSTAQVLHPFSKLGGNRAHGAPILMNRSWLRARLRKKLRLREDPLGSEVLVYQGVLERAQPRIIFTVGLPEALAFAARRLGIPVVEVLHGRGYSDVPWGWDRRATAHLPTDVFALDERSMLTFQQLQSRGVSIHQVMDPWTQLFLQRSSQLPDEWKWPEGLDGNKRRIVVVSLQWGYAGDHGAHDQFSGILENGLFPVEIERVIRWTANDTQWLFRLHPVQMYARRYLWTRSLLEKLEKHHANVEWRTASRVPLPTLLGKATHHVTMLSGSTYEAAEMGVPTALLCPTAQPGEVHGHWFQDLIEMNYVTRVSCSNPGQLLDWLDQARARDPLLRGSPSTVAEAISRILARART